MAELAESRNAPQVIALGELIPLFLLSALLLWFVFRPWFSFLPIFSLVQLSALLYNQGTSEQAQRVLFEHCRQAQDVRFDDSFEVVPFSAEIPLSFNTKERRTSN